MDGVLPTQPDCREPESVSRREHRCSPDFPTTYAEFVTPGSRCAIMGMAPPTQSPPASQRCDLAPPVRVEPKFPAGVYVGKPKRRTTMGRGLLLWLIGIPIPIILLIWLFGGLH
jgi:hypothetical protein